MAIFGRKRDDGPASPASDATAGPTDAAGQVPGQTMGTPPTARDADIGVPPYRPTPKDTPMMSMAPKPTAAPATPSLAPRPAAPGAMGVPARPQGRADAAERRTLVVGRGISLQGTVTDAERLVVEGTVESEMIQAAELFVAPTGVFRGEVQVEDAEIAGLFDGTVTARGSLVIRGTGKVNGTARYRKLAVEEGGQISGRMEMITEGGAAPAPRLNPPEA